LAKDDAGKRAQQDMMGGTLEIKKDMAYMAKLIQREEWMDKNVEEMTEEER